VGTSDFLFINCRVFVHSLYSFEPMLDLSRINIAELVERVPCLELLEGDKYSWESLGEALNLHFQVGGIPSPIFPQRKQDHWWLVRSELFALICTRAHAPSAHYRELEENQSLSTSELLSLLSNVIAKTAAVHVSVITPLVATVLYAIKKQGSEAWCYSQAK
jgi:hypothetical protein